MSEIDIFLWVSATCQIGAFHYGVCLTEVFATVGTILKSRVAKHALK